MMASLAWLLRKHCIQHADPLFDRDEHGRAVFRCPECLHTWPILPNYEPRPLRPAPLAAATKEPVAVSPERRVERRVKHAPSSRPAAVAHPRRIGALPVM